MAPTTIPQTNTRVPLEKVLNFRDVGKTVNEFLGKKVIREGVLYRSARPDDATPSDRQRLVDEYNIKTVLDLRNKAEHLHRAEQRAKSSQPATAKVAQSHVSTAAPLEIPGLAYRHIPFSGRSFERFVVSQLGWWSFFRLLFLYLFGYRTETVRLVTQEVILPKGLIGMGIVNLDVSGAEICESLRIVSHATPSAPLLLHCTAGKDRTGTLVLLTLFMLNIPLSAINHDYRLTETTGALLPEKEERMAEMALMGFTEEWAGCPEDFVQRMVDYIDEKYGGIEGYADRIGFTEEDRKRLREGFWV